MRARTRALSRHPLLRRSSIEERACDTHTRHRQAGAVAGIIAMSATYPLDMVRGRLTVQTGQRYRGIVHATRTIVAEEGARALYKGWLPSVIGVVPYVGLNFAVYESLKDHVLKRRGLTDERDLDVVTRLSCGAVAGSVGQTVAYPLDVVRRRMQTATLAPGLTRAPTMAAVFKELLRTEGVHGLFKGLSVNYFKAPVAMGISFSMYHHVKERLTELSDAQDWP